MKLAPRDFMVGSVRLLLVFLCAATLAVAQETPAPTPGQLASAAAVCGPANVLMMCRTWTRYVTVEAGPLQVSRCQRADEPYWQPEGRWDRLCYADAPAGEACMANAIVIGPRRVVCDGGTWAP